MNETLIKLLRVYIVGDAEPGILGNGDKEYGKLPESDDFLAYLRQVYREQDCSYSWYLYQLNTVWYSELIWHFHVAITCIVWLEELEKDYLKIRAERVKSDLDYKMQLKDVMNGRTITFRDYDLTRHDAISSLNTIVEKESDLPLDITACLLDTIADLHQLKWWESEINPWGASIHFWRGNGYEEDGNIEQAIREYRESLRICPDYLQTLVYLGELYERCMNYDEAEARYKALIRYDPDFPAGYYHLGELYTKQGRSNEAAELHRKASELEYEADVEKHINEGIINFRKRQLDKAIEEIQASLILKPDQALAYAALAIVYAEAGDKRYHNTVGLFKKAVETNYSSNQAYLELSLALVKKTNHQELLKHLWSCRKLINYSDKHFTMANLVQTYIETLERQQE